MFSRGEDVALLLGRLFVAALFLPSGVNKLTTFSAYAASLAAKGLPYSTVIAAVLIAAEVLGPVALIVGAWPRWTALALVCLHRCHVLDHPPPHGPRHIDPNSAERRVLSNPGDHGWAAVLLRRRACSATIWMRVRRRSG